MNLIARIAKAPRRLARPLAVAALTLMLAAAGLTHTPERFILNSGKVVEGDVIRETDALVFVRKSDGKEETILKRDIAVRQTATPSEAQPTEASPAGSTPAEASEDPDAAGESSAESTRADVRANDLLTSADGEYTLRIGVPKAAIITLGEGGGKDMVGIYMTSHILRELVPLLKADGVETVVFRINSGGGLLLEIQRLSDVIHNEYKPNFRVAAWIESAISAAAMTAHCIEEIYFCPEGNYGACTGWSGQLVAVDGRDLDEVVYMMEKISARGGYNPAIMAAMQIFERPLSATIDPATGNVRWYQTTEGQHLLNTANRILTFDSEQAAKFKFSRGTAKNLDELSTLMGLTEVQWVGKVEKGHAWPISKAERANMRYRDRVAEDERRFGEYVTRYQAALGLAQGTGDDRRLRGAYVGQARRALNQIIRMVDNNPNFGLLNLGVLPEQWPRWKEDRLQELRDLLR